MSAKDLIGQCLPPILVLAMRRIRSSNTPVSAISPPPSPPLDYQGVITAHNMRPMHEGRFAELYDRYRGQNPENGPETTRMRWYLLCMFASWSKHVPGDFLTAGISYGVAPRIVYDYIDFPSLHKSWHFVDPFTGVNAPEGYAYNTDAGVVKAQYPPDSGIVFHECLIPDVFTRDEFGPLAFVHLNTGHAESEALALPYLYERLSPRGCIVIDLYAHGKGYFEVYDPVISGLGAEVYGMVTGQGIIRRPIE